MPKNRIIYVGILLVAASALLYIGGQIIRFIEWILPWTAGVGVVLVLLGMWFEAQKNKKPKIVGDSPSPTVSDTSEGR